MSSSYLSSLSLLFLVSFSTEIVQAIKTDNMKQELLRIQSSRLDPDDKTDSIDCVVSDWSACNVPCGNGKKTRSILTQPSGDGVPCPTFSDEYESVCFEQECDSDCVLSPWSKCDKECGTGTRHRTVEQPASGNGATCGTLKDTCNTQRCPINCVASEWGKCSAICWNGDGETPSRTRSISVSKYGGKDCTSHETKEECNAHRCPIDCKQGPWSECSAKCWDGSNVIPTRTRSKIAHKQFGGLECAADEEIEECNTERCSVDCALTEWSSCSVKCGQGVQTRKIAVKARGTGSSCPVDPASFQKTCDMPDCIDTDCVMSPWGKCDGNCASASRTRTIKAKEINKGDKCGNLKEICTWLKPCPATDCIQGKWSECSKPCWFGAGEKPTRSRTVTLATYGGVDCDSRATIEECNVQRCPIDCVEGKWGDCSAKCWSGIGKKPIRTRAFESAKFGGEACPQADLEEDCNVQRCPIDCVEGKWGECPKCWSGIGKKPIRTRAFESAKFGGEACPQADLEEECKNVEVCPALAQKNTLENKNKLNDVVVTDCQIYPWGPCSQTCTPHTTGISGIKRRRVNEALNGGKACPKNTMDFASCNTQLCDVDCVMSDWGSCLASDGTNAVCGGGQTTRTILQPPIANGKTCPIDTVKRCNEDIICPVDCKMSEWTSCDVKCGGGLQIRNVLTASAGAGKSCPNKQMCPEEVGSEYGSTGCLSKLCNTIPCFTTTTTPTPLPVVVLSAVQAMQTTTTTLPPVGFSCSDYDAGKCEHVWQYLCEFDYDNDICVDLGTLPENIGSSLTMCADMDRQTCIDDSNMGHCKWDITECKVRGSTPPLPLQVFTIGGITPSVLQTPQAKSAVESVIALQLGVAVDRVDIIGVDEGFKNTEHLFLQMSGGNLRQNKRTSTRTKKWQTGGIQQVYGPMSLLQKGETMRMFLDRTRTQAKTRASTGTVITYEIAVDLKESAKDKKLILRKMNAIAQVSVVNSISQGMANIISVVAETAGVSPESLSAIVEMPITPQAQLIASTGMETDVVTKLPEFLPVPPVQFVTPIESSSSATANQPSFESSSATASQPNFESSSATANTAGFSTKLPNSVKTQEEKKVTKVTEGEEEKGGGEEAATKEDATKEDATKEDATKEDVTMTNDAVVSTKHGSSSKVETSFVISMVFIVVSFALL